MQKNSAEYFKIIAFVLSFIIITLAFSILQFWDGRQNTDDLSTSTAAVCDLTVVIDAGHGGIDCGAVGISGSLEKEINLALAECLSEFLSITDVNFALTRRDDNMLLTEWQKGNRKRNDLQNRVEAAKSFDRCIFVSIHQNKFPIEKYKGLQVYHSANNPDSRVLSQIIQDKTKQYLQPDNIRKIKEAGKNIYLLDKLECPSVLVECGFLSNAEDEKNLMSEQYRRKLSFVLFSSLMDYITQIEMM